MGLDMYLSKKKFLGWEFEHRRKELAEQGNAIPDLSAFDLDSNRVSYITEEVAYWRKANAIHRWFVDTVQGGVDDCSKQSLVSKKDLEQLLFCVKKELVIKDNTEEGCPGDFLPTQPGFFFGSYEYDEWFYNDLERTQVLLEQILKDWDEDADYYYQSSW
jgi:hypothetical protein